MTITVNGTNITPFVKHGGLTFSRNDVEAPDAGRTLDGLMHRGRVAVKERIDIQTIPLTRSQLSTLLTALYPESLTVTVNPYPLTNGSVTMTMYSNSVKTTHIIHRDNGEEVQEVSFPLVEV